MGTLTHRSVSQWAKRNPNLWSHAAMALSLFCTKELSRLNIQKLKSGHGSVQFTGTIEDAYQAMLWSRMGGRVLMEIGRFEGTTQDELYDGVYDIPWEDHMNVTGTLWIDFTGQSRDIRHTQFAARKAKRCHCRSIS